MVFRLAKDPEYPTYIHTYIHIRLFIHCDSATKVESKRPLLLKKTTKKNTKQNLIIHFLQIKWATNKQINMPRESMSELENR